MHAPGPAEGGQVPAARVRREGTTGYADAETVRAARSRYFAANGFAPDGGYASRWVRVKLGPVPVYIPNTAARVRAVRLHDLHHVATGYDTDLVGEAEIGAWELASGCRGYVAAWWLNLTAVLMGLVLAPRRVARAFRRGRGSRNLYAEGWSETLLDETVGDLRERLALVPGGRSA
jgi:hypothetical protein